LPEFLGRHEDKIGALEQLLFTRDDLPGSVRAAREVVDAVIDRQARIDGA
jgi:hypothetical protein